ncbi:response regulator transcription factor [Horticoccus sp. 23ND18S-11]|uniref:response regulator transcription factor n=1 Tax=Horticoccus sp. 23ND18S-11 TaxID=3391832 RepID=UPI0039C8F57E
MLPSARMTAPKTRLFLVDDDPSVRLVFRQALVEAGYAIVECENGEIALERLKTESPALFVLDVEMPRLDGWQTLAELRRRGCTQPVLMITRVNDVESRVRGLAIGADDYIGKPCSAVELVARVRALLRRASNRTTVPATLRFGEVVIDLEKKTAARRGEPLRLTRTDYALLSLLRDNLGKPVSREAILKHVWEGRSGNSHALDTHLWRLRRKLGDTAESESWLRNLPGIGYVMTTQG